MSSKEGMIEWIKLYDARIVDGCLVVIAILVIFNALAYLDQSYDNCNLLILFDFSIGFRVVLLSATIENFFGLVKDAVVVNCSEGFLEVVVKILCGFSKDLGLFEVDQEFQGFFVVVVVNLVLTNSVMTLVRVDFFVCGFAVVVHDQVNVFEAVLLLTDVVLLSALLFVLDFWVVLPVVAIDCFTLVAPNVVKMLSVELVLLESDVNGVFVVDCFVVVCFVVTVEEKQKRISRKDCLRQYDLYTVQAVKPSPDIRFLFVDVGTFPASFSSFSLKHVSISSMSLLRQCGLYTVQAVKPSPDIRVCSS
uniref:Uncharacterized protein n=1 Tax=Glossina brevipalpis TaxID=37001 RepID=A0A1A9WIY6_9MUSC